MTTRNILDETTDTMLTVNEYETKKEIVKIIQEWKDSIKLSEHLHQNPDMYIFVLYEDGSTYARSFGEEDGKFRYTHIKTAILDDGYEYYIYGEYEMNENTNYIPTTK